MTKKDKELLEDLRLVFKEGWFTAHMAKHLGTDLEGLLELARKGYLDASKSLYAGPTNFRVRPAH